MSRIASDIAAIGIGNGIGAGIITICKLLKKDINYAKKSGIATIALLGIGVAASIFANIEDGKKKQAQPPQNNTNENSQHKKFELVS